MERLGFIGGAYAARSTIAAAQRSINYYPEINPKDSPSPVTLYQRPGLAAQLQGPPFPVRLIYRPSNGNGGYCVIGSTAYWISPAWQLVQLGQVTAGRVNPCSMIDNGTTGLLVDGSATGWTIRLSDNAFAPVSDPTGTFNGADRVDTLDTYILWNMPGTISYGSTLSGLIQFDGLYFAGKSAYPDLLQSLIVNRREIILFGSLKSEIWYDAGNANFPFAELPGAYIEHGLAARYSVASEDINVFWLSQDLQGQGFVFMQRGYETRRISNHALEWALEQMVLTSTISDAIGFTVQLGGHTWYVLTFPSGNQTWAYDSAIGEPTEGWHQWAWTDANGALNRHRANCFGFVNGVPLVGDWQNGAIYRLDPTLYTDEVAGAKGPITFLRSWPYVTRGRSMANFLTESNGLPIQHNEFWLDCETGNDPTQDVTQQLTLRYSNDRGKSWFSAGRMSAGRLGEDALVPRWGPLGTSRFRIYEVSHSVPAQLAINGAWIRPRLEEQHKGAMF